MYITKLRLSSKYWGSDSGLGTFVRLERDGSTGLGSAGLSSSFCVVFLLVPFLIVFGPQLQNERECEEEGEKGFKSEGFGLEIANCRGRKIERIRERKIRVLKLGIFLSVRSTPMVVPFQLQIGGTSTASNPNYFKFSQFIYLFIIIIIFNRQSYTVSQHFFVFKLIIFCN